MRYFETKFLDEAEKFIARLDQKAVRKSFTTLTLLNKRMTQDFSRRFKTTFGNFVQNMQDFKSDYLHFGTSQARKKLWLLQLMVS